MSFLYKSPCFQFAFLVFIFLHSPLKAVSWSEECDGFVAKNLQTLRETRSHLKRPNFPFAQTNKILDFIEKGRQIYGIKTVAADPHVSDLIIDICDIVNLQHPDFKTRYDIFIEQWEGTKQLPFSLFSFDRIAQVFHYSQTLFNVTDGSAYRQMVEKILEDELPILNRAFKLIHNVNVVRDGQPLLGPVPIDYEAYLRDINNNLERAMLTSGSARAREQKIIKTKTLPSRMKNLCSLSAMAHDYLTLGRVEEAVKAVLGIPAFTDAEQREAFLAGMIQIGELSTNKNLSYFVRQHMPTIPWEGLVHCRDAIEHQDEHGFSTYFASIVEGSNLLINLTKWQEELKILSKRISDVKRTTWNPNPQAVFDTWLQRELAGAPLYGVVLEKPQSPPLIQAIKKIFRQTPLFKRDSEVWGRLINGSTQISYTHLQELKIEINNLKIHIATLLPSQNKVLAEKFLSSYENVEAYLWNRLSHEAIHLSDSEKNALINTSQTHFDDAPITNFCLALLNLEQPFLTIANVNLFRDAALLAGLDDAPLLPIFLRFHPEMMVTRQVCYDLPFDNSKDLGQPARKQLAQDMFLRTAHHLHILAHDKQLIDSLFIRTQMLTYEYGYNLIEKNVENSDNETKRKFVELNHAIILLQQNYGIRDEERGEVILNPEGTIKCLSAFMESGLINAKGIRENANTNGFREFALPITDEMCAQAHKINLPGAIRNKPVTYLASLYSLSVGIGALKEWVLREAAFPVTESTVVEKLRDGRNFIAHGDILRNMNSINLADIQENLLTDHLDHCAALDFI